MRRRLVSEHAGMRDIIHLVSLDAAADPAQDSLDYKRERAEYWRSRITNNPGTVFLAIIDGVAAAGFLAVVHDGESPDQKHANYRISPLFVEHEVMASLLLKAKVELNPVVPETRPEQQAILPDSANV